MRGTPVCHKRANELHAVPRTVATRAARVITEVLAPAVLAAAMPLIVGATHHQLWVGLGWGTIVAVFSSAIPYSLILRGVAKGALTDWHIRVRSQRARPIAWGVLSVVASLVLALTLDAPRRIVAMIIVMLTVLVLTGVINLCWKSSGHAAVASGSATVLGQLFGTWAYLSFVLVAAVCWSRVLLRDHTLAQTVVGVLLGVGITLTVWRLIT